MSNIQFCVFSDYLVTIIPTSFCQLSSFVFLWLFCEHDFTITKFCQVLCFCDHNLFCVSLTIWWPISSFVFLWLFDKIIVNLWSPISHRKTKLDFWQSVDGHQIVKETQNLINDKVMVKNWSSNSHWIVTETQNLIINKVNG